MNHTRNIVSKVLAANMTIWGASGAYVGYKFVNEKRTGSAERIIWGINGAIGGTVAGCITSFAPFMWKDGANAIIETINGKYD
jgi:hypothetical protein